jgi:hypothetical protein
MPPTLELILTAGFQRLILWWLSFFTLLCVVLAAVAPLWSKFAIQTVLLLPFMHCVLFCGVLILCSLPHYLFPPPSDRYLRDQHPAIWKKLHPWGRFSYNSFTMLIFMLSGYDDGRDEHLQLIKRRYRRLTLFQLWSLALLIVPFPVLFVSAALIELIAPQQGAF